MKLLRDQLSDTAGKKEEDDVKIKEFDVGANHCFNTCTHTLCSAVRQLGYKNVCKKFCPTSP